MSTPVHGTPARPRGEVPVRRPPGATRRESAHPLHALQARAGNAATYAAVQRARGKAAGVPATDVPATVPAVAVTKERKPLRERIAAALARAKKSFDISDTFVSRGQIPANAGVNNLGATSGESAIGHAAAASGFAVGVENFLADGVNASLDVIEARKARKDRAAHPTGPASHQPRKKTGVKPADALSNAATTGGDALSAVKDMLKHQALDQALAVGEASGAVSGVLGVAKAGRHTRRLALTQRKYSALKGLDKPARTADDALARLGEANSAGHLALGRAYVALDRLWDEDGEGFAGLSGAVDTALEAVGEVREAAAGLRHAEDANALADAQEYALGKQRHKMGKLAVSAAGESLKAAGGAATIATAVTAGLAATPVGWGLAAGAAGLLLGGALYKAGRAGRKRYEDARDPQRYAPEDAPHREPASKEDALKEALRFWRGVEHGKRQAVAREIYRRAAGEAVPGSEHTAPDMRASARALLVALKAGPAQHGLSEQEWAATLDDPERTASWHAEIAAQLSSG
ncbi:hypothetical protein ACQYWQ_17800 [Streptomyces sp. P6-2-1]|uniref:hypothetical protein n=1 Tax=Streptomyces sp. P6-2-1 TaxID=3422591 RepID=UPI003D35BB04